MHDKGTEGTAEMVECWYWRYLDQATGQVRVTDKALTATEAAGLPQAQPIESTKTLRASEEEDTTPDVFRTGQAPLT
jgi:hypothetical protein